MTSPQLSEYISLAVAAKRGFLLISKSSKLNITNALPCRLHSFIPHIDRRFSFEKRLKGNGITLWG